MRAEIISIGTEILLGEITDTNAAYLASQLPLLGFDLHFISTVGDNKQRLIDTLKQAWQRSDIIITTGGLGPTEDDITRDAIAELFNEELKVDPELAQEIRDVFKKYGLEMPPNNLKQAMIIPSAQSIPLQGTAPGWWLEQDGKTIIAMPGPPREMQSMWEKLVFPKLQQKTGEVIVSRTLKTFGLGESKVDELVSHFLTADNPTLGIYAKPDGIHLRITAKSHETNIAQKLIKQRETDIRKILNDYIWGTDSDILENIVGDLLAANKLTLATMESHTGGILANTITNAQKSTIYYKGGLVAYCDETQIAFGIERELISKYGLFSAEATEAMATASRKQFGAAIGIGLTVMDQAQTKTGKIFISIDDRGKKRNFTRNYPGNRSRIKQGAVISALFELRKTLLDINPSPAEKLSRFKRSEIQQT